ncbi:MAG: folate-binding protein YgfZ [Rhodanobacteraceae bacterium]
MAEPSVSDANLRTALDEARCIEISGEDARAFAQAQFSGDVRALQPLHWQWNAWLDHKGGVRALMHLGDPGNGRLIALLRGGDMDSVCAELRKYVLRARVRIEPLHDQFLSIGPPLPLHELRVEEAALGFGCGDRSVWLEPVRRAPDAERQREFHLDEIRQGWPRLPPGSDTEFLPPALGLEHLGAVSFEKGCYPGQEITARLHYRGGHKRRLIHALSDAPLRPGWPLEARGRSRVLDAVETTAGWHALAVVDIDPISGNDLRSKLKVIQRFDP